MPVTSGFLLYNHLIAPSSLKYFQMFSTVSSYQNLVISAYLYQYRGSDLINPSIVYRTMYNCIMVFYTHQTLRTYSPTPSQRLSCISTQNVGKFPLPSFHLVTVSLRSTCFSGFFIYFNQVVRFDNV
jgi:hypothetical protein